MIGPAIEAAREASTGHHAEIIVSDDHSTDCTGEIARQHGALVVTSGKRNIGATRNVGAAGSSGDYLFFIDADTLVNARAFDESVRALDSGAIAGGACFRWTEAGVPFSGRFAMAVWNTLSRVFRAPAGGYFFMTRDAFNRTGGFDESFFVSEELWLGRKLRTLGQVVIIKAKVQTSARKLKTHSITEMLGVFFRLMIAPFKTSRSREALDLWYTRR